MTMKHLLLPLLLAGCMSIPADPSKMSAEQLKAFKEKSASAACTTGTGPWGAIRTVLLQLDAGTVAAGSVTVTDQCGVTINVDPKPPKP